MGQKDSQRKEKEKLKKEDVHVNSVFNDTVNKAQNRVFNGLHCLYTNADSLPNKLDELKARLQDMEKTPEIIGITEIYPKNCRYLPSKAELGIDGFELFLNATSKNVRGTALYVKNDLQAEEINLIDKFQECILVKLKLTKGDNLLIGCMYKSPNSTTENIEELNKAIIQISNNKAFSHILLMGDFNYPKLNWKEWKNYGDKIGGDFMECIRDGFLHQHVTGYTRTREGCEPSTIDLVLTNEEDMIDVITHESPLGHSDHCILLFNYRCYYQKNNVNTTEKWNFNKGDYNKMSKALDHDWDEIFQDMNANQMYETFISCFNEGKDKYIPKIRQRATEKAKKHNYLPLDKKTTEKIKKKHKLWQKYMETRDQKQYKDYVKLRNQVKSEVRKAKRIMEKDIAKNAKENPKKFWKYANSKRKTRTGISELKYTHNGEITSTKNDQEKANVLANFFTSVFTNEPQGEIPTLQMRNPRYPYIEKNFEEKDVKKLLEELNPNKSMGPDGLHPKALKELSNILAKPLTMIFNKSMEDGNVPQIWKLGNITAIFKKGDKSDPGNYRPVSLTSVICKTMEKLVRNNIVDHMKKNNLFSNMQFGFISGRSTTLQLLKVMDEWTEIIDSGGYIDSVYMDFMKAFDKVPHRRLIGKMKSYGIGQTTINWVKNFLSERKQRVTVNGEVSACHDVTSGIPQGSVLGPILFVIYINDMPDCVEATAYLFADDTKIYKEVREKTKCGSLQNDLDNLQKWSDTWLLKFHPNKCKVMSIANKRREDLNKDYHLYDEKGEVRLELSEGEKDIGVLVDDQLNFSKHIQQQINKANSIMGLIRRTYTFLDEQSFKYLFQALVRPHLEYAAAVWSPYKQADIENIENVQKRATKQVPTLKNLEYPDRLRKLKMPTLKYRRLRGDMIETFKIMAGIYDKTVTEDFLIKDDNSRTRGHEKKLKKKYCRLNIRKYSFTNRVVDTWNSLPSELINAKTVVQFEIGLDRHWEQQEVKYDFRAELNINLRSRLGGDENLQQNKKENELDLVAEQASVQNSS